MRFLKPVHTRLSKETWGLRLWSIVAGKTNAAFLPPRIPRSVSFKMIGLVLFSSLCQCFWGVLGHSGPPVHLVPSEELGTGHRQRPTSAPGLL